MSLKVNVDRARLVPREAEVERGFQKHLGGVHAEVLKAYVGQDLQHLSAFFLGAITYGSGCHVCLEGTVSDCLVYFIKQKLNLSKCH